MVSARKPLPKNLGSPNPLGLFSARDEIAAEIGFIWRKGKINMNAKPEKIIGWAVLILLLLGCLVVLRPFLSALLWAIVLCSSSWPGY